jgi:ABC-type bacteriocin/lantibiotic exporter with double-glycine peptidase domain
LRRGALTVLIGANGGGKTSLARLILALYRPSKGYLSVDGIPFDEIGNTSRKGVSFTAQDPELFAGTIH